MRLHRAGTPARDLSIVFYLSSFLLLVSLLTMCFQIPTITTTRKPHITHYRQRNPNNLRTLSMSANTLLSFSIGLWNCQSAVNKADFITSISSYSRLNLMALIEAWIKPEDNSTPAALSNNFYFSHTPCLTGRCGGTGLLISNNWKFTPLPSLCINSSFESHSFTITYPLKIHFVVVYRPLGPLGNFVEELDVLLSTFPEDGTPLVILGDFNIHLDKPQAADFHTLLTSFDLKRVSTTATHKSGNQLDLIYTRHCSTDHVLVTPLHTLDHFLLTLNLNMIPDTTVVYIRQLMTKLIDGFDLCDLSPLPHTAHPHCDHPRRVDPSNEIQMLQSSCVKLRRHPGCYPVGGKTINELLRNVLKILWSNFLMGTSVWAPLPICGTRGVRLYAFSPSPSLSLWDFLYEKKTIMNDQY